MRATLILTLLAGLTLAVTAAGCNTVSGFGRDLQIMAESVKYQINGATATADPATIRPWRTAETSARQPEVYRW
ncbi:MAG: hypothetical protein V3U29_07490 [Phycisphaeraceae bacterium]